MDEAVSQPLPGASAGSVCAGRRIGAVVRFVLVAAIVLAVDLAVKDWAFHHVAGVPVQLDPSRPHQPPIPPHDPVVLVPGLLSLKLTTNAGAVFGLGQGGRWVFIAISVAAVFVVTRVFWRSPAGAWGLHAGLALILAGALGNLYDRVRFSVVRDMLVLLPEVTLPWGWTWPGGANAIYPWIFNVADVALVVGVALVIGVTTLRELRAPGEPGGRR
ncbi:MAG TPA: signal peptidase II [Phycisphaeraceae bacterium]